MNKRQLAVIFTAITMVSGLQSGDQAASVVQAEVKGLPGEGKSAGFLERMLMLIPVPTETEGLGILFTRKSWVVLLPLISTITEVILSTESGLIIL